ncbi:LGFP repeat-containing protein [Agromyces albus]|uniref:LGFP repeat-containing protein n=1 Tax=Agromyces albus TaxID=205332 RepID=UPI00277FB06C|nr:hypothetical protein [Agromyces albus]MDQ0576568.1 uncharacterized protein with LGFP repeats [Agromyces albus]
MTERMTRIARRSHPNAARPDEVHATRVDRALSWSDFRAAVRYDPANRLLVAVPAISAKRAEHPWLGEATGLHTRIGTADAYHREFTHGSVYWSERTGAHEVHGAIAERWKAEGGEASFLGFPTTDEQPSRGVASVRGDHAAETRRGRFAHFEGGSIYWTPLHGAAIVHGMVRDIWALLGWENSALGVPVGDVVVDVESGVHRGVFERGSIEWSPARGPIVSVIAPAASDALDVEVEYDGVGRLQTGFAPQATQA